MFKFATNKFNGGSGSSGTHNNNNTTANSTNSKSHSLDISGVNQINDLQQLPNISMSNATAAANSRRRQIIHKDLFAFNRIADKGFPSKPSAMDYDKKLKLLAIGTKNGDIRIYGSPGSQQQQLSCYQDVHPFPIQRILFIQGHHQLITVSERVQRNDMTNKSEPHLFLVLWQIPVVDVDNQQATTTTGASYLVEKIKEFELEPEVINGSRLSAITLLNDNSHMFLGFETGDVYVFNVAAFQLVPGVINKDFVLKNLLEPSQPTPQLKKLTQLGAVESICHHPRQLTKLLIAYQRGLWIIFDFIKNQIDQINQTSQQLESAVFYQAGECVATSHSDGSFILWDLENQQKSASTSSNHVPTTCSSSAPNIVYGPYPCKSVNKCLVKTCKNDQPYVIFSGGCPRINYSDKITISVIQGENSHICFDFTSKIIDYFTIDKPTIERNQPQQHQHQNDHQHQQQNHSYDNPQALFVLLEEEFVAIDLCTEGWPQYKLPYLYSVHSSAIICTHYVNNVSGKFYDYLKAYGNLNQDSNELYSDREWPINNNPMNQSNTLMSPIVKLQSSRKDLLLTGHEDGSVRFWDVTNMSMTLIYRLKTSDYFQTDSNMNPVDDSTENANANEDNDNWPPFRKVGTFDPYSDDPKLGIQKIYLCAQREILVVAGTAGQVLIMHLNDQCKEYTAQQQLQASKINLIGSSPEVESCFVWKGHEPLLPRTTPFKLQPGYQLQSLVQLYPPATVSALALSTDWQLVSMGTSHGFALFDYLTMKPLLVRCTLDPALILQQQLNPNDSGNYGHNHGNTISRRKSLKKSLRESFRKLRRGRSQKPQAGKSNATRQTLINTTNQMRVEHIDDGELNGEQHRPIERQVESREFKPMDDIPPSVIRYMYFVRTFITNSQQLTNSLWVGTNTGIIYIYALQFSQQLQQQQQANKSAALTMIRTNQIVNCLLAKEMRLKHRAPVVNIQVIDQNMQPLPFLSSNSTNNDSSTTSSTSSLVENHKVIICSEEQFKVFQLPTLKPVCKFKLTAVEGARVRRIGYNCYTSRSDPKYTEHCLSCLSNLGDISVYSLPQLKRQVQMQCMKQQDINAITSFVFSKQGQAFYLQSPSEFVHISMSARDSPATLRLNNNNNNNNKLSIINNTNTNMQVKSAVTSSLAKKQQETNQMITTKPRQQTPTAKTQTNTAKLDAVNPSSSSTIESPSSPPPPVPAPRTILPKDEPVPTLTRKSTNDSKQVVETQQQQPVATKLEIEEQKIDIDNKIDTITKSPTKSLTKTSQFKESEASSSPVKQQIETMSVSTSIVSNSEVDASKYSPIKKQQQQQQTILSEQQNISLISTTTSGVSQLSSLLDQSSMSSNTNSNLLMTHTSTATSNNINSSMLTMTQSDSFNVSSSGYNGSVGGMSSFMGGNVDISMDSVVDKFNDEYHDVSTRKIPPVIDENISTSNQNNDSLLNESNSLDLNRLNLNQDIITPQQNTNGKHHQHYNGTNGHTNGTFEADPSDSSVKQKINNKIAITTTNNNNNGYTNGHHLNEDDDIDLAPQKSSSPLIKKQGQSNGNHANNNSLRINKIEQVTKRIENGSKLEYRETAID